MTRNDLKDRPSVLSVALSIIAGLGMVAVGVAGLILPILPGWLLIIGGVVVLAGVFPPLRRAMSRMLESAPAQKVLFEAGRNRWLRTTMARAMQSSLLRRGLDAACRWQVIGALLAHEREAAQERDPAKSGVSSPAPAEATS